MDKVLGVAVVAGGSLSRVMLEVLGGGRKLADQLGAQFYAALVGARAGNRAVEAIACGADTVLVAEDALLGEYQVDVYLSALEAIIRQVNGAGVVLFGADQAGQELAPRLARRLGTTAVTDCIELRAEKETGEVACVRPVYGGKAVTVLRVKSKPLVATVRRRTMEPAAWDGARIGETVAVKLSFDPALKRTQVVEQIEERVEGPSLEEARVVVSGGRGVGGPEGFRVLQELAQVLRGAVGASRAAVDAGWVSATWQVGQTGKIVGPDLYFAIGISGASQHLAGISAAKCVVAINTDAEAPIFKAARLGVAMDYRKVTPFLIQKLKEVL